MRIIFQTLLFSYLIGGLFPSAFSQKSTQDHIDSLHRIRFHAPDDSSHIRIYNFLSWYHEQQKTDYNLDSAMHMVNQALTIMQKPQNLSVFNYAYIQGASLASKQKDFVRESEFYILYLDAAHATKNKNWEGEALASLCRLFYELKDHASADKYAQKLVEVIEFMDNDRSRYSALNKLGTFYKDKGENDLALSTHLKAMELALSLNAKAEISHTYNNIGLVYKNMEAYDDALTYYLKSIKIKEEINDKKGLAGSYINTAFIYYLKKDYKKTIDFAKTGLEFAEEVNAYNFKIVGLEHLFNSYSELKLYPEATQTAKKLILLTKEVYDQNMIEQTRELEQKYQSEKNKKDLELLKKEAEFQDLEILKQRDSIEAQDRLIAVFASGLIIVLMLSFFLIRSLRQRKSANRLLETNYAIIQEQKQQVELQKTILQDKNQEVLDSINYAKRIQTALLPPKHQVDEVLNENFILYTPKDIVAGDFYWLEKMGNSIYVAAADCTGHGVPGAMVSVVCFNGLNKSLHEHQLKNPCDILDKTREEVIAQFGRSGENVQDGMDIGLVRIKQEKNDTYKLQFSGANNPLWVIRNQDAELLEIDGDKQPIGTYSHMAPFQQHELELKTGDLIYLLTDGFQDQFGGETDAAKSVGGKKFKPARLKQLLLDIRNKQMDEQHLILQSRFHEWKGDLDQVDDVCIIGVRL